MNYTYSLKNINFINEKIIPKEIKIKALNYCKDIDINDTIFLSLTFYLNALLWTGDKVLKDGLKNKKLDLFFNP